MFFRFEHILFSSQLQDILVFLLRDYHTLITTKVIRQQSQHLELIRICLELYFLQSVRYFARRTVNEPNPWTDITLEKILPCTVILQKTIILIIQK